MDAEDNPWAVDPKILEDAYQRGIDKGFSHEEIEQRIHAVMEEAAAATIENLTAQMQRHFAKARRQALHVERRQNRRFDRRLRQHWKHPLDVYQRLFMICRDVGNQFNEQYRPGAARDQDFRFEALCRLHSRACTIASEIHALLRSGHAPGATARWRTLFEHAVVARVIEANDGNLARRYLEHDFVSTYLDAELYQHHCAALGMEPVPTAEMAELKSDFDVVTARHGTGFAAAWGWASPMFPTGRGASLDKLITLADLDDYRPFYKLANHETHSGSRGAALNMSPIIGGFAYRAGPSHEGLDEPGQFALVMLLLITTNFVTGGRTGIEIHPQYLAALQASIDILSEARDAFHHSAEAHDEILRWNLEHGRPDRPPPRRIRRRARKGRALR